MRTVNKDNPRNIKCEHCKYWGRDNYKYNDKDCIGCVNPDSPKYAKITMYYNRCKQFEWHEKYTR